MQDDYEPTGQEDYQRGRAFSAEIDDDDRETELTDAAAEWSGWGTALKPSIELICLARKPLSEKSVAANVLRWGTGALCHDGSDEVLAAFPSEAGAGGQASGPTHSGQSKSGSMAGSFKGMGDKPAAFHGDQGSAARFFYSAKAGPLDRLGSAHPTVKPVDLMRWLCRLICPPGGHLLDPFAGSGSTGIAALAEGMSAELIDLEPGHVADIERKLALLRGEGRHLMVELNEAKAKREAGKPRGDLFDQTMEAAE
jgi:site-specific DNA-methyltransferase (adenine-specific)